MLIITNWKALNINIDNDLMHEVKKMRDIHEHPEDYILVEVYVK